MPVNPIAVAIPLFFLAIGIEFLIARRRGVIAYRFNDSIADLSCGISQQALGVFNKLLILAIYVWAYENCRIVDLSAGASFAQSLVTWFVALLWVDFAYYWWHRASHRVNFMWAVHVVHHQSQEYNLSVALRQALFSSLSSIPFYLPLALLGVSPVATGVSIAINTLYQFWIHTRLVGRLGFLEKFMNTASHHRVHHGINPRYIDKNYAAVLIVWDRLFGTFEPETEEPVYGTVKPFTSWNPIWANFEYWAAIWQDARRAPKLRDKLLVWFKPPEWSPEGLEPKLAPQPVDAGRFQKWDTPMAPGLPAYITFHFVLIVLLVTGMLFLEEQLGLSAKGVIVAFVLATLLSWSGLLERRRWALKYEYVRLAAGVLFPSLLIPLLEGHFASDGGRVLYAVTATFAVMHVVGGVWFSVFTARNARPAPAAF